MQIDDYIDEHLSSSDSSFPLYVITLNDKSGKYTSRENVNVNLIRCNITEFCGDKGYSNISASDIIFKNELKNSEFYIYNSVINFNNILLTNCKGEFYNCYITGKVIISSGSKVLFRNCYFTSEIITIDGNSEIVVEGKHKQKSKVGYNDIEIPEGSVQFQLAEKDDSDNKYKNIKLKSGILKILNIDKVYTQDYFIYAVGGKVVAIKGDELWQSLGTNSDSAVVYGENCCIEIKQVSGMEGEKDCVVFQNCPMVILEEIGSIIAKTGKACSVTSSTLRMRQIGELYSEEGTENLTLKGSSFYIYGLANSSYTKTITIDNSNGSIDNIGTFFTNGEAFKINSSDVSVKNVDKVKVGKDFIQITDSILKLGKVNIYQQPIPQNYINASNSEIIAKDLGNPQVEQNFILANQSKINISNIILSSNNLYVANTSDCYIYLHKINGTSIMGINDTNSEIFILESFINISGSPLLNCSDTKLKIKESQITGSNGLITYAKSLIEVSGDGSKIQGLSAVISNTDIYIIKGTLETTSGNMEISNNEILLDDGATLKSSGVLTISGVDLYGKFSTIQGLSISISGNEFRIRNNTINGDISISNCNCEVIKSTFSGEVTFTSCKITSRENVYSDISFGSSQYIGFMDSLGNIELNSSYLDLFNISGGDIAINNTSSMKVNHCNFSSVTISDNLIIESNNSTLGNISGGTLQGVLIGGSASISSDGDYLLIGSNASSNTSARVVRIGGSISGVGVSVENNVVTVRYNDDIYVKVDGSNSKIILNKDSNVNIEVGSSNITQKAIGGQIDHITA